jgi:hypothetical protein
MKRELQAEHSVIEKLLGAQNRSVLNAIRASSINMTVISSVL